MKMTKIRITRTSSKTYIPKSSRYMCLFKHCFGNKEEIEEDYFEKNMGILFAHGIEAVIVREEGL